MRYTETLQHLGLSPNEAKIYEALIENGESTISDISVTAKVHRRNAYDAVSRLIDKGLCFQVVSPAGDRFGAVDPNKLKELVGEKEKMLKSQEYSTTKSLTMHTRLRTIILNTLRENIFLSVVDILI